jgi:folylpolyglutamate synthase/dihydropteroate synthase
MQNIFIQEIQREILIDCAHNIAGIQYFLDFISKKNKKKVLIFGMLQRKINKDIINILQNALNANAIDKIITVNFGEESINATALSTKIAHKNCRPSQNFMEALILSKQFDEIFLCGSIHLVGEFFKEFNLYNS